MRGAWGKDVCVWMEGDLVSEIETCHLVWLVCKDSREGAVVVSDDCGWLDMELWSCIWGMSDGDESWAIWEVVSDTWDVLTCVSWRGEWKKLFVVCGKIGCCTIGGDLTAWL